MCIGDYNGHMKKLFQLFAIVMLLVSAPIFAQPSFADQSFNVNNSKLDTDLDIARSRGSINRTDETQDFVQSVESDSGFGF